MIRRFVLFGLSIGAIALALGGYAVAQDTATPGAEGTPVDLLCATPVSETNGEPDSAATPGATAGDLPCGTPDAGSTPVAGTVISLEFFDIGYDQTELTIPADTDVTFRFVNNGVAVHNFKIEEPRVYSDQLYGGDTVELTVNLPAGTYTYYCTIPGHRAAGMVGTLTVE